MENEIKRLFFGIEVFAPWPERLPPGRILDDSHRHVTMAFLGEVNFLSLEKKLEYFPSPPFNIGIAGQFDRCLFLPEQHPNVVAWRIAWLENCQPLVDYQQAIIQWLQTNGLSPHNAERTFLPHVTICRKPFRISEWHKAFHPLLLFVKNINLYESMGNLRYEPRWTLPMAAPFEEIEHTADIAFRVRGKDLQQMHLHAIAALSFRFPQILQHFSPLKSLPNLDEVIIELNKLVSKVDSEFNCPFKAISFHGKVVNETPNTLLWEMIVDV